MDTKNRGQIESNVINKSQDNSGRMKQWAIRVKQNQIESNKFKQSQTVANRVSNSTGTNISPPTPAISCLFETIVI